jgi:integral membrane sensor domain MASE1
MPARALQREWLLLHHTSKWAVTVLYLAAYIILEWASFIHVHKGLPITPWDPGLGVAFALLIRGGPLSGLIVFAGMVVAETFVLQNDVDWPTDIGVAAITATSYASVAALVQRYFWIDADLTHLRDVLVLLAAGLAGALLNTVLVSAFLLAVGQFDIGDVVQVARPLLIGDAIGIAVVTPLLLRFRVQERLETSRLRSLVPETALYLCLIGLALWLIVGSEEANMLVIAHRAGDDPDEREYVSDRGRVGRFINHECPWRRSCIGAETIRCSTCHMTSTLPNDPAPAPLNVRIAGAS